MKMENTNLNIRMSKNLTNLIDLIVKKYEFCFKDRTDFVRKAIYNYLVNFQVFEKDQDLYFKYVEEAEKNGNIAK